MNSHNQQSDGRAPSNRGQLIEDLLNSLTSPTEHRYEELKSCLEAVPLWAIPLIIAQFPHTPFVLDEMTFPEKYGRSSLSWIYRKGLVEEALVNLPRPSHLEPENVVLNPTDLELNFTDPTLSPTDLASSPTYLASNFASHHTGLTSFLEQAASQANWQAKIFERRNHGYCAICNDNQIPFGTVICALPCGHSFHTHCLVGQEKCVCCYECIDKSREL